MWEKTKAGERPYTSLWKLETRFGTGFFRDLSTLQLRAQRKQFLMNIEDSDVKSGAQSAEEGKIKIWKSLENDEPMK